VYSISGRSNWRAGLKVAVFSLCTLPFVFLLIDALQNNLGPDPVKTLSLETGEWTLRFLILALAVTPAKQLSGIAELVRFRRMIGLFALYYASWHFLVYLMFLLEFRWSSIFEDIMERPYITVGFSAYLILVTLGITSPNFMVRKLGRKWKQLHKLVYLAGILGVVHLVWIVRSDLSEAVLYGFLVFLLLAHRVWRFFRAKNRQVLSPNC
jgi:methionine sulfoxide reductase heme-binding subunit